MFEASLLLKFGFFVKFDSWQLFTVLCWGTALYILLRLRVCFFLETGSLYNHLKLAMFSLSCWSIMTLVLDKIFLVFPLSLVSNWGKVSLHYLLEKMSMFLNSVFYPGLIINLSRANFVLLSEILQGYFCCHSELVVAPSSSMHGSLQHVSFVFYFLIMILMRVKSSFSCRVMEPSRCQCQEKNSLVSSDALRPIAAKQL